jgi:serine/threonine protein kinase
MKDSSYYQKRIEDMQHDPAMLMMSGNFSPEKKKDQFIYMKGQILNNRYVIYRKLGSGTFGLTIEAYDQFCNQHVAIKVIKKSPAYFRQAQSEIEILTYLNEMDPNSAFHIVRMLDHFLFQDHQCIVFELLSSSLLDLLHKNSHQGLSINLVCRIGYQLFEALDFLSSGERPVSHCDIKPENVLFEDSNRSALRLIDFGSSCFVDSGKFQNYVQSRYYRAPEVLLGLRYSPQIE